MTEDDRRSNANRDRLDEIHKGYVRFAKLAAIAIGIQAIVLIVSLTAVGYLLKQNHDNASRIKTIALGADFQSEQNRIQQKLAKEKVCSQSSNRLIACRALFDRLSNNISDKQRHELACAVLEQMRGSTARVLRRETKCNEKGGP